MIILMSCMVEVGCLKVKIIADFKLTHVEGENKRKGGGGRTYKVEASTKEDGKYCTLKKGEKTGED